MKMIIVTILVLLLTTPTTAQISEKTGAASTEISEGANVHKSRTVTTTSRLRGTTKEQRKAEDEKAQQDATQRPPSRIEMQMKQGADIPPAAFPVR